MVIIKYPKDIDAFTLQKMCERFQKENPKEHFLFIRDDITYMDLSLKELYEIKKEIEKAIYDKEIITLYEKGTLDDRL